MDESDNDYVLRLSLATRLILDNDSISIPTNLEANSTLLAELKEEGHTAREIDKALKQTPEAIIALAEIGKRVALNAPSLLTEKRIYQIVSDMRISMESITELEELQNSMMEVLAKGLEVAKNEAAMVDVNDPAAWRECQVANRVYPRDIQSLASGIKERSTIFTKLHAMVEKFEFIIRGLELSRKITK